MSVAVQFGNGLVELTDLLTLGAFGRLEFYEDEPATLYFTPTYAGRTLESAERLLVAIARLKPDECTIHEGRIRFWWD